jgi:predicted GIY-YIG superfamily endonuclease
MRKPKNVFVYLLHFHQPIAPGRHTCQHYMGSAEDLQARLTLHTAGQGARLCQVALERGITWELARVWEAPAREGRKLERKLKNRKAGPKLCPICANGGALIIDGDVNFYPVPPDFAAGLADVANGASYCKPGIDWAAVEEDRIGD